MCRFCFFLYRHRYRLRDDIFRYDDGQDIVWWERAMHMTIADMRREIDHEIDSSSIAWLLDTDTVFSETFVCPLSLDMEAMLIIQSDMDAFFLDASEREDDHYLMWWFVDIIRYGGHGSKVLIKLAIVVMIVIGIVCRWCDDLVNTIFDLLWISDIVKHDLP